MDDPFVSCPFNASHRVPRSRLQGHIAKCQEKHPGFEACPYNATHRLPPEEMKDHVKICPFRDAIFPNHNPPKVVADLTTPSSFSRRPCFSKSDPVQDLWDDERA